MFFRKYRIWKILLYKFLKSRVSKDPWTENRGNGWKHWTFLNDSTFTVFINHCEGSCIRKNFLFVIHKILRLFLNTLTVDDKIYLLNKDNLTQLIQMQLSQKQKTFSGFFFFYIFKKSILNVKHFPTKDDPHSWCISGNTGSKNCG